MVNNKYMKNGVLKVVINIFVGIFLGKNKVCLIKFVIIIDMVLIIVDISNFLV